MSDAKFYGIIGALVGMFLTAFIFGYFLELYLNEAIDRGYALHCPKDGTFAWKGECNDKP